MIQIPSRTRAALDRSTISTITRRCVRKPVSRSDMTAAAAPERSKVHAAAAAIPAPAQPSAGIAISLPRFTHPIQKGQKVAVDTKKTPKQIHAKLGWREINPQCDVDVSAFLLGADQKVPGDDWFVFYGQTHSPDQSVVFSAVEAQSGDPSREVITVDLEKLHPDITKIVYVLTIHDAFDKHLNFSMIRDAYILLTDESGEELAGFQMTDYYENVTSMMIGELYKYNGHWKFSAVGNGVASDLPGLCARYGVQVES